MFSLRQAMQKSLSTTPNTQYKTYLGRFPRWQCLTPHVPRTLSMSASLANQESSSSLRAPTSNIKHQNTTSAEATQSQTEVTLEIPEPRLSLTFTCTVTACGTRSSHQFTKRSYEGGIVIVECPGCKNRHLIADHLDWFKESTEDGKLKTVEDMMRAKGEKVRKGVLNDGGVVEYAPK